MGLNLKKKLKRAFRSKAGKIVTLGLLGTAAPSVAVASAAKSALIPEIPAVDKAGIEGAMAGLRQFGRDAQTEIGNLQQGTQDLQNQFQFNPTDVNMSGLDQFAGLGGTGIGAFEQGIAGQQGLLQDPSSILNDPLIQAQLKQGIGASEMGAGAGGTQLSGGQLRELQTLGNTFAGTQIDNQFNRFGQMAGLGLEGAQVGLGAEQFGISTDLQQQQGNQAGMLGFNDLRLRGQEQFANIGLAGLGIRGDVASQRLGTEADLLTGARGAAAGKSVGRNQAIGTAVGLGLMAFSDRRVKENIKVVGKLNNGLPVYSFNYIGDATPTIGLMAQDVEKVNPEAVITIGGIKRVFYDKAVK